MRKGHLRAHVAAKRLGHCTRWLLERIGSEFEGFKHGPNDVTVSVESIEAYEDKVRIGIRVEKKP